MGKAPTGDHGGRGGDIISSGKSHETETEMCVMRYSLAEHPVSEGTGSLHIILARQRPGCRNDSYLEASEMRKYLPKAGIIRISVAIGMTAAAGEAPAQPNERGAGDQAATPQTSLPFSCSYLTSGALCGVETFSRKGASASMFDSTGQLTFAPNNLLLFSNGFSDPAWAAVSAKITPDATNDPFGGKTGWSMESLTNNGSFIRQAITVEAGLNYVNTLYLAPGAASWAQIDRYDNSNHPSWINLSKCEAGVTAPGTTLTVAAVGGGWCKIDQAFAPATATVYPSFSTATGDNGGNAGGSNIHVYGEQLSLVTYQTKIPDYYPTTDAPYYGPRFGYAFNGSKWAPAGLLLEDFRKNYVRYSNDLTNPAWVRGATITVARDQTGIDGVANGASSLTGGSMAATNTICQSSVVSYSERIFSAYVRRLHGNGAVKMATDAKDTGGTGASWRTMTITPNWTRVWFTQKEIVDPITCFKITTPGDKIAVQYVQNETVPNEPYSPAPTSPISTTDSFVSRGREMLFSVSPALLQAKAFIVEASGLLPATDNALLGLSNLRDELSIGLGEAMNNRLYSTYFFPRLSTASKANWKDINRAGLAWGGEPVWNALSLNGRAATTGTGVYDALEKIYWGSEPNGGKSCNCFLRSWAAYSSLTREQLSAKSVVGAPY